MRLLIKILPVICSFLLFNAESFAQECKAKLIIETNKNDALIYINKNPEGKGRLEAELDAGKYIVTVIENNKSWDSKSFTDTIFLEACNHQRLNYNFNSDAYIQTQPEDAAATRNDSLLGYTPLFIADDYRSLKLSKPGYEDKVVSLNQIERDNPFSLNFIGSSKEESFFEKDIFKYLVGSIVVLGGTTAYFKLKADDKFEEYQLTGNQALRNEVDKYDLISGITFTALQINFGILIYYFLID